LLNEDVDRQTHQFTNRALQSSASIIGAAKPINSSRPRLASVGLVAPRSIFSLAEVENMTLANAVEIAVIVVIIVVAVRFFVKRG
jgi:hypothetical protein